MMEGGGVEKLAILCELFLTHWNRKAAPYEKLSLNCMLNQGWLCNAYNDSKDIIPTDNVYIF